MSNTSINDDEDLLSEIIRIKAPPRRNGFVPVTIFGLLMLTSYIIPMAVQKSFNFTSLSAFFSILGAFALWWESNHSDAEIIPDFNNITDHRGLTIPGLGWLISYLLVAAVLLILGTAFAFSTQYRSEGIIIFKSVSAALILVLVGAYLNYKFNNAAYNIQSLIRIDVMFIKNLPDRPDQMQLAEASRRIRRASKLARNTLRSIGFFLLLVGGCFVLADELRKIFLGL